MTNKILSSFAGFKNLQSLTQRLPEIFSVLLITGSAYTAANITWAISSQNDDIGVAPVVTNNKSVKPAHTAQVFRNVSNAHLFGKTTSRPKATKAPVTKLNFILKGVLAAIPMSLASAIIARKKNGPEESYSVGDRLPGNVTIKEIHPDHVIIERGGQLETLRLQKDSGTQRAGAITRQSANTSNSNNPSINDIRSQILKKSSSFVDYALPIIAKENGKQVGYRLDIQEKGGAFKKAGLRANDIIISINGDALDTPGNSMRAVLKLRKAKKVNLVVRRNGSDVNLNLRLQ